MKKVCLDSICTKRTSTLRQKDLLPQGGYPVYGASGIVGYLDYYQFEEDYLSIIKDGAGVGRVQLCRGKSSVLGTLQPIIPKASVNISYLRFLLSELHLESYASGATIPHIYFRDYGKHIVALPDCEGQAFISCLFEVILTQIGNAERIIFKLDELIKSRFIEMFGDPADDNGDWSKYPLSSLGVLERGVSKRRPRNAPELLGGPYPLIQTGDVTKSELFIRNYSSTYSELGLQQSKIQRKGTLCITIAANIAQTAILDFDACFPDSVVGFVSNERTNAIFVHYWFSFFREILEHQAPESAQKNINLKILRSLKVIVPPVALQNEFAEFVTSVEAMKATTRQRLDRLNTLYDSLAQQYFAQ